MLLEPTRKAKQDELIRAWAKAKGVGTLQCATGFGKTIMALLLILAYRKSRPSSRVQVVVPSRYLADQWAEKIPQFNLSAIRVSTIQSLLARINRNEEIPPVDLLILDEVHSYTSEQFSKVFDIVEYKHVLGLTATLRDDDEKNLLLHVKAPVVAEVTLQECVDKGWVSPFLVYNLGLEMDETDKEWYKEVTKSFKKSFGFFQNDWNTAIGALGYEGARQYSSRRRIDMKVVRGQAINWKKQLDIRKNFLYDYPPKIDAAEKIIRAFPEARVLVFAETTSMADKLAERIGIEAVAYHSNLSKTSKGTQLFKDPSNVVRVICTARALDQGTDLPDVDFLIVLAGTSTALQGLQRYGRGLRFIKDKKTKIVEIYVKGTQDETWLKGRQRKIPRELIIWVSSIPEIVGQPTLEEVSRSISG